MLSHPERVMAGFQGTEIPAGVMIEPQRGNVAVDSAASVAVREFAPIGLFLLG
jgi:hypothetical protein